MNQRGIAKMSKCLSHFNEAQIRKREKEIVKWRRGQSCSQSQRNRWKIEQENMILQAAKNLLKGSNHTLVWFSKKKKK